MAQKSTISNGVVGDDTISDDSPTSDENKSFSCHSHHHSELLTVETPPPLSREFSQCDYDSSGQGSKQPSPVATAVVQPAQPVLPPTIQQPLLQDSSTTQATPEALLSMKVKNAPQIVKKGRFTVSQKGLINISNRQSIDRTVTQATQVQKGRFTVTLEPSVSAESDLLPTKKALTSTTNVSTNGIENNNNLTGNVVTNSSTAGAKNTQTTTVLAPQIVKKKGRFMVTSVEPATTQPTGQGSTDSSLLANNEVISVNTSTTVIHGDNEFIPTPAPAGPQFSMEAVSQSSQLKATGGTPIIKFTTSQGPVSGVKANSDVLFLKSTNSEDHNLATPSNPTTSKPVSVKRVTSGKPPASFDSKGVGSVVGLGKVLYYLDQMRNEVSEADQTLKAYQKEIRFLKERNKELEQKWRETEKRLKEEKMHREASDSKVRNLKKKIKDIRDASDALENEPEQARSAKGSDLNENLKNSENMGLRKSFSHGNISDELTQIRSQYHQQESNKINAAAKDDKTYENSPCQQSSCDTGLKQKYASDAKLHLERATTAALQSFSSGTKLAQVTNDRTHIRHSSEIVSSKNEHDETMGAKSISESNHRRRMSTTSLPSKHIARTNCHTNSEDKVPSLNTGNSSSSSSTMPNGSASIATKSRCSMPVLGTQSINPAQQQQVSQIVQHQQQNMSGVQQNVVKSQQVAAGQTQQSIQTQQMMVVNANHCQQQQNHQQWNNQGQFHSGSVIQSALGSSQQLVGQSMLGVLQNHNGHPGTHQQPDVLNSSHPAYLSKPPNSVQTSLSEGSAFQQTLQPQLANCSNGGQQQQFPAQQPTNFSQTQQRQHTGRQWG